MRITKIVKLTYNADSPKEIEWSLEYDGWHFDGTREEVEEELSGMMGQVEISAREEKIKRGFSS